MPAGDTAPPAAGHLPHQGGDWRSLKGFANLECGGRMRRCGCAIRQPLHPFRRRLRPRPPAPASAPRSSRGRSPCRRSRAMISSAACDRHRGAVGPVGGDRVEDVGGGDDAGLEADLVGAAGRADSRCRRAARDARAAIARQLREGADARQDRLGVARRAGAPRPIPPRRACPACRGSCC